MASLSFHSIAWPRPTHPSLPLKTHTAVSKFVALKRTILCVSRFDTICRNPSSGVGKNVRPFRRKCSSIPAEGAQEQEQEEGTTPILECPGELRVPQAWVDPQTASREAEWLRVALHQWLDDEFCPEPANEEISLRCSKAYYYCLLEQQLDVGDILMQMVRGLETFSFKNSFHGAFSSANAAIDLITQRMRSLPSSTLENKRDTVQNGDDTVDTHSNLD